MTNKYGIAFAALVALGAFSACGADAAAPGAASPAAAPATPQSGPAAAAAAPDATPAAAANADPKPAAQDTVANNGATNAKDVPAATPKGTSGDIIGQVDVTPARLGKNVVVYLDNAPSAETKQVVATVDQRRMAFSPFVTAIPVGGKVIFRNNDPFPHNIFSPDGSKFDLGTMPHGGARVHVFNAAGAYTLLCNIHPGMLAYIEVVPSRFYTLADKDGKYTLKNVPPGTWKISAWGPKLATATQSVTVSGGQVTANLSLHRGS